MTYISPLLLPVKYKREDSHNTLMSFNLEDHLRDVNPNLPSGKRAHRIYSLIPDWQYSVPDIHLLCCYMTRIAHTATTIAPHQLWPENTFCGGCLTNIGGILITPNTFLKMLLFQQFSVYKFWVCWACGFHSTGHSEMYYTVVVFIHVCCCLVVIHFPCIRKKNKRRKWMEIFEWEGKDAFPPASLFIFVLKQTNNNNNQQ
jgi:hypothetical protein